MIRNMCLYEGRHSLIFDVSLDLNSSVKISKENTRIVWQYMTKMAQKHNNLKIINFINLLKYQNIIFPYI